MVPAILKPWWFSDRIIRRYMSRVAPRFRGKVLDAGCGFKPYGDLFNIEEYIGVEYDSKFNPDVVADLRNLNCFEADTFDGVISNQVLEHVDEKEQALAELFRVLKPEGLLCITIPLFARVHGEPYDFWRFTRYGVEHVLKSAGFVEIEIQTMGGFTTTMCLMTNFQVYEMGRKHRWLLPLTSLFHLVMNPVFLLMTMADKEEKSPPNYIALARKPKAVD